MVANRSMPRLKRDGFANVNGIVIGGGFTGGILCGAFFLWNMGSTPTEPTQGAIVTAEKPTGEARATAPVSAVDAQQSTDAAQLQKEVADLKQELEAERLRNEVSRLRGELSAMKSGGDADSATTKSRRHSSTQTAISTESASPPTSSRSASAGELTLAYWNSLNEIIAREASMRSAPLSGLTAANAGDFLNRRADAGRYASSAIRKLEKTGVDQDVVQLAGKLARWYDDNVSVAGSGGNLLGADAESRQGQPGKQYQSSERGLQQGAAALNREGEQIRGKMSQKYSLDFPKLQ